MAGPSARFGVNVKSNDELEVSLPTVPPAHGAVWWSGRAAWAVLDQGLFASSNFALGILLARWVSSEQFGSFAVAQSCFLLVGTLHTGLFSEPMLVFGSARHDMRFPAYLEILLHAHWWVTGVGSFLLACVAVVCWYSDSLPLAGAFLGAAVGTPFILFGWLVRRACFARLQPQWAATGGGLYLLLLITGIYLLSVLDILSAFSALILLGGAGLISGRWILGRLQAANPSLTNAGPSRSEVFRDHWNYGRWSLASSGLSWIPGNLYYILIPTFAGLQAAGALKALSNLVMPILHFNSALASLFLPTLASTARRRSQFNRLVAAGFTVLAGGSLVYGIFLTMFRVPIVTLLYGPTYGATAGVVTIIALLPLGAACTAVLGSALRALERPQHVFWAYVASTTATLTLGIWAVAAWGLIGAAVGLLLSSLITALTCGAFLMRAGSQAGGPTARETCLGWLAREVGSLDEQ